MVEFYVYELRDPRTCLPFYVGKGKGDRINAHEGEARRGVSSTKCERIKEIWAAGLQVEKEKIEFFDTAKEAFRYEAERISEIGRANLTNFGPVNETIERKYFHYARCFAALVKIRRGALRRPDPELRPWAHALYGAVERMDFKAMLNTLVAKAGFDNLKRALLPHGIDLQRGG